MLKEAMKAKDAVALGVYRALLTGFMNELVAKGKTPQDALSDEECMAVVRRGIKQREDSYNQFTAAGRDDLATPEIAEKNILLQFLPAQMSEVEIAKEVANILGAMMPLDAKNLGRYIGACAGKLKDVASGDMVKKAVEEFVNKNS